MQKQIINAVEKLARYLRLKDGLIHSQFIWDGCNIHLIDRNRRIAGDLYSQLIELSTGHPYVENYVRPFLDMPYKNIEDSDTRIPIMRHTVSVSKEQNFNHISFKESLFLELGCVELCRRSDQKQARMVVSAYYSPELSRKLSFLLYMKPQFDDNYTR